MKIDFVEAAKVDLVEAVRYYNREREGLGFELAAEVKRTIKRILEFPHAWTRISKNARRCRTSRFPYGIIYSIEEDRLLVLAVMHSKRHPDAWRDRA